MPKDREMCAPKGTAILLAFITLISLLSALSCGATAGEDSAQVVIDVDGCKDSSPIIYDQNQSTVDNSYLIIDNQSQSTANNGTPPLVPSPVRDILVALAVLLISITGILGVVLLYRNFGSFFASGGLKDGEQKTEDQKRDDMIRRTVGMILGIAMVLSSVWVILYLLNVQTDVSKDSTGTAGVGTIIIPVLLAVLIFGAVLLMCSMHVQKKEQEVGTMRKTIAGLLVLGLVVVIFYSLSGKIINENIITQYIQLVGVIIAFYFGSRVAGVAGDKAVEAMKSQYDASSLQDSASCADGSGQAEEAEVEDAEGAIEESKSEGAKDGKDVAESGGADGSAPK